MSPPRLPDKICAYAPCGRAWHPSQHYARARYCTKACASADRGAAARREAGRKGGQTRGTNARPKVLARYKALAGSLEPWEAFKLGARWQFKRMNDRRAKALAEAERRGFARGWSAAIGETGQTRRRAHEARA